MEGLLVMLAVWAIIKFFATRAKNVMDKKTHEQKKAIEEQRRLMETYEAEHERQQARPDLHPWQIAEPEADLHPWQVTEPEMDLHPWQVTEPEADLHPWQVTGPEADLHPWQVVVQEAKPHHIDAAGEAYCATAALAREEQRKKELRERKKTSAPTPGVQSMPRPAGYRNVLVNGIIMREILGPPRAKRQQTHHF